MKNQAKWVTLLSGVLSIIAGIYMLSNPIVSMVSLAIIYGILILFSGVAECVLYFTQKEAKTTPVLLNAIISILLGICILTSNFFEFAMFIPYLFAFWVLFTGITRIMLSVKERKESKKTANISLLVGALGILCGVAMLLHPLFTEIFVAYMIAFAFLYEGIASIFTFFKPNAKTEETQA